MGGERYSIMAIKYLDAKRIRGSSTGVSNVEQDFLSETGGSSSQLDETANKYGIKLESNNPLIDYPLLYGKISGQLMASFHLRLLKHIPQVITCSQSISESNNQLGLKSRFIGLSLIHI